MLLKKLGLNSCMVTKRAEVALQVHSYTYNDSMTNLPRRGFAIELKGGYRL